MIKNYIQIAIRILFRNKVFSLINILGLAFGLTSCLLIYIYVSSELSFDRYHKDHEQIFRVVTNEFTDQGIKENTAVPYPFIRTVKSSISGLDEVLFIYAVNQVQVTVDDEIYKENGVIYTDSNVQNIFSIEIVSGSFDALSEPNKVLITEAMANKFFGNKNPLGKIITFDNNHNFEVGGIVKEAPYNSHLPYNIIASSASMSNDLVGFDYDRWDINIGGFYCYLKLQNGTDINLLEKQINEVIYETSTNDDKDRKYLLQKLTKIHLSSEYHYVSAMPYTTNPKFLLTLSLIGLFILLIASINFVNLATVQAIKRGREIGIRKIIGASKSKLIFQNLGETFFIVLLSEIIAVILAEIFWPQISTYFQMNSEISVYSNYHIFIFLLIVLIIVVILSGIYPAIVLSKFSPIKTIKSSSGLKSSKTFSLRNLLVTFQFVISQILIIASIFISLQISYINNKDLGFHRDSVWSIELPMNDNDRFESLGFELEKIPELSDICFSMGGPISRGNINTQFSEMGTDNWGNVIIKPIDIKYKDVFGIDLLAGRWINRTSEDDSIMEFIVNKALIEEINIHDPQSAIGTFLEVSSNKGQIVGVTENFNVTSLKKDIPSVAMMYFSRFFWTASFHVDMNKEVKKKVAEAWKSVYPEYLLELICYNDEIDELYKNEKNTFQLILFFSLVAIVIACLGLYGLISYIVVQRTKEVGIRKVLGAPVSSLIYLVAKQFLFVVFYSCLIAWPIAYYVMKNWLNQYAYKIDLNIWVFVISGFVLMIITILTIINQSIKVSNTNPVEVLKYE